VVVASSLHRMAGTLRDDAMSEVQCGNEGEVDYDHDGAMSEEQPGDEDESDYEELDEIEERVVAQRWQCDVCYVQKAECDTRWTLSSERSECRHSFCTQCIQGLRTWDPVHPRCPYDNAPVSAQNMCGVMTGAQFVEWEKQRRAQLTGSRPCSSPHCAGIVRPVSGQVPAQSACDRCSASHCGRRQCGAPWVVGHRCPDIVEAERVAAE